MKSQSESSGSSTYIYVYNFYIQSFVTALACISAHIESDSHVNLSGDNNQNKNALYDARNIIKNENLSVRREWEREEGGRGSETVEGKRVYRMACKLTMTKRVFYSFTFIISPRHLTSSDLSPTPDLSAIQLSSLSSDHSRFFYLDCECVTFSFVFH